jgi:hypothetical protein
MDTDHAEIFNDCLIFADYISNKLYAFNGDSFEKIFDFPENGFLQIIGVSEKKLWLSKGVDYYSINSDWAIIKEVATTSHAISSIQKYAIEFEGDVFLFGWNMAYEVVCHFTNVNNGYAQQGYIETKVVEGELIPIQLILKAKKVATGETIKVYIEKNLSGTWEAAALITLTAGNYISTYNFANNYGKLDFVRFKIEINTTIDPLDPGASTTPEIYSLTLLYLPSGLENAK